MSRDIIEELADSEHVQWCKWSRSISRNITSLLQALDEAGVLDENCDDAVKEEVNKLTEKINRWRDLWIPYDDLSEEMKERDRKYAREMLELVNNQQ